MRKSNWIISPRIRVKKKIFETTTQFFFQEISNRTHFSRTPNKPEYLIARSQLRGPLGFGPIQFLMDVFNKINGIASSKRSLYIPPNRKAGKSSSNMPWALGGDVLVSGYVLIQNNGIHRYCVERFHVFVGIPEPKHVKILVVTVTITGKRDNRTYIHMDVSKNRGKTPKMDDENNGKPWGFPIFLETPI